MRQNLQLSLAKKETNSVRTDCHKLRIILVLVYDSSDNYMKTTKKSFKIRLKQLIIDIINNYCYGKQSTHQLKYLKNYFNNN